MSRSLRFARSFGLGFAGQGLSLAANFLLIPVLMRALGTQAYGLYILLHTATSYVMLATLGAGPAVVRYTAEFRASGDGRGLRQTAAYALIFHIGAAVVGLAAGWTLAPWIAADVLRLGGTTGELAVFVLRAAAAAAAFWIFFDLAQGALQGLQLFGWHALLSLAQNAGFLAVAAALAWSGRGLRAVAVWFAVWGALLAAAGLGLAWARLRDAAGAGRQGLPADGFLRYAVSGGFGRFAWIVTYQFDKVYAARAVSLSDMTLYSVPAGLLQRLQMIRPLVSSVIVPMMSELRGEESREHVRRIYLKSVRFVLWSSLPALALLFAVMPQFLGLWLGAEFASKPVWPARLLVVSQVFYFLEGQAHIVMFARDKPWHLTALVWLQALSGVVFWKLLAAKHAILGIAAGTLAAQALCAVLAVVYTHRRVLHLSWRDYAAHGLAAPAVSGLLALSAVFPWRTAVTTWPRLGLAVAAALGVYYGSAWIMMSEEDRGMAKKFMKRAGWRKAPDSLPPDDSVGAPDS